jgi:hypothetical protein
VTVEASGIARMRRTGEPIRLFGGVGQADTFGAAAD